MNLDKYFEDLKQPAKYLSMLIEELTPGKDEKKKTADEIRYLYDIQTSHVCPPVPFRGFDWCATLEGYGGEYCEPIGHGKTEDEAIENLYEEICQ